MLSRKTYKMIALRIYEATVSPHAGGAAIGACNDVRAQIANGLADDFARDNPRFKRDVFLKACEVEDYNANV